MTSNLTNTGKPFEHALERTIIQYQAKGILRLKKVDPPTRTFGNGKKIIHLKNPFLDYCGCWTRRGGRAIFFEAKSTKTPTLSFGSSGISDNQLDALRHWTNAGAICFVLWQTGDICTLITVAVINQAAESRKHLKISDGYPVKQGFGNIIHDFETVMARVWPAPSVIMPVLDVMGLDRGEEFCPATQTVQRFLRRSDSHPHDLSPHA